MRQGCIDNLKEYIVLPQHFTILHFLSQLNDAKALEKALDCGISYTLDFQELSPIKYCIDNQSYDCEDVILNYLARSPNVHFAIDGFCKVMKLGNDPTPSAFKNIFQETQWAEPSFNKINFG